MMKRSIEDGRWTATFRPRRLVRAFGTSFLALWLCAWAAGEAVAAGILLASLGVRGGARLLRTLLSLGASLAPALAQRFTWREFPGPQNTGPLGFAFIGSWFAIWTLAGLLALHQMLRLLASEDRIAWDGARVEVFRRVGPFRSRRAWRAERIEHLSLSRADRALLLHTPRSTHTLTAWGSKAERAAVRDEIRKALRSGARANSGEDGSTTPSGWAVSPLPDGGTLMVRDPGARRVRAALSWAVTIALGALAVIAWSRGDLDAIPGLGEAAAALVALLVLGACVALSVWLSLGGTRIALREGEIEFRPSPLTGRSVAILDEVRLAVEHTTDDDGDDWFELQARSRGERRTIDRRMNEPDRILGLARWIAERCGAPLDLGRGVEESEEDEALAA